MGILELNSVENAMTNVVTMGSVDPISKAIRLMDAGDLNCIIIMDSGDPVGILTKSDIIRIVAKNIDINHTPVSKVMESPLLTIQYNESIENLLRLMEEKKVHHIPVMKNGKLVGIVDSQRIRSLGLLDALSIFTISAHAHYTPYLYTKMSLVYESLADRLKNIDDIPEIVKIVSDELRRQELVDEITVEQNGDEISITVKDCMYSKSVHPFIEGDKELCVMGLLTTMAIQKATGKRVNFVNFCDITDTGSKTRILTKS